MVEGETEDLMKKEVILNCFAFICLFLYAPSLVP